jgi:hypothetical protein
MTVGLSVESGTPDCIDTIDAMARMARQTRSVVHLVLPREPGIVENARVVAYYAGVDVSVDELARTVRLRFDGTRP